MKQYGLIGFPLDHSFSPGFFAAKFKDENIDARYDLFPLRSIDEFKDLIGEKDLSGLNVTIPYKETILPFLDELTNEAKAIGAVNTISFNGKQLIGHNTDAPAFEQVLHECGAHNLSSALVFGTGGASKAITFVLRKLGIRYQLISRNASHEAWSYDQLNASVATQHLLWINTTPVGQYPNIEKTLPLPFQNLTQDHICIDLIYNPDETTFLRQARDFGATGINGLTMLQYQAEKAWKLWQA